MKYYLILLAFCSLSFGLKAQDQGSLVLNAYGGYTFKDKVNFDGFYGYTNAAFQYGGGLEYFFEKEESIELKYLRMGTHFPLYTNADIKLNEAADKGTVNYFLVGGNNYFGGHNESGIMPFLGVDVGVGVLDIQGGGRATKFAWDAKAGVKISSGSVVSVKLQA